MVTRAVFADRDGVLCANIMRDGRPVAPTRLEDFRLLPGVEDSVRALKSAGYLVIVVTNQPDVGTGRTARATVEAMHDIIRSRLAVDDIKACFHTNADDCACRKPKAGHDSRGCGGARISICLRVSWSATAGATSPPARKPAVRPSSSITAIRPTLRSRRTRWLPRLPRRQGLSSIAATRVGSGRFRELETGPTSRA